MHGIDVTMKIAKGSTIFKPGVFQMEKWESEDITLNEKSGFMTSTW